MTLPKEPPWTRGFSSLRGTSLLVVGEQIGDEGKTPPWLPPGLKAGSSGVRGGDEERLPGRRIEGRKRRSRSRRGGVRGASPPLEPE
jgi:hypothetical protein